MCSYEVRKFQRKTLLLKSLFNQVAGLQVCNFIKKRLQHRRFPVRSVKFFKSTYFEEQLWTTSSVGMFLKKVWCESDVMGSWATLDRAWLLHIVTIYRYVDMLIYRYSHMSSPNSKGLLKICFVYHKHKWKNGAIRVISVIRVLLV